MFHSSFKWESKCCAHTIRWDSYVWPDGNHPITDFSHLAHSRIGLAVQHLFLFRCDRFHCIVHFYILKWIMTIILISSFSHEYIASSRVKPPELFQSSRFSASPSEFFESLILPLRQAPHSYQKIRSILDEVIHFVRALGNTSTVLGCGNA